MSVFRTSLKRYRTAFYFCNGCDDRRGDTSWNWSCSVLLPCSISRSENEATSWTQFIEIVQSKMADKNRISRPVSMFWKKCTLMLHGGMLAESFFCRVVACKFQHLTAALLKRMYKHQETLATLLTRKKSSPYLCTVCSNNTVFWRGHHY